MHARAHVHVSLGSCVQILNDENEVFQHQPEGVYNVDTDTIKAVRAGPLAACLAECLTACRCSTTSQPEERLAGACCAASRPPMTVHSMQAEIGGTSAVVPQAPGSLISRTDLANFVSRPPATDLDTATHVDKALKDGITMEMLVRREFQRTFGADTIECALACACSAALQRTCTTATALWLTCACVAVRWRWCATTACWRLWWRSTPR